MRFRKYQQQQQSIEPRGLILCKEMCTDSEVCFVTSRTDHLNYSRLVIWLNGVVVGILNLIDGTTHSILLNVMNVTKRGKQIIGNMILR